MADRESGLEDAKVMEMSVSEQWVKVLVSPALWALPPHVPCHCTRRFHPWPVPATSTEAETVTPLKQRQV